MNTQSAKPAWKDEVNRRLAAHMSRKGAAGAVGAAIEPPKPGTSRAADAAARVAARYAKAPSYTQLQAEEARVAVRAAEIATQVAIEAQAVAESALAELHAATVEQPLRGPAVIESIARPGYGEVQTRNPEPILNPIAERLEDSPANSSASIAETDPEAAFADVLSHPPSIVTHEMVDGRSLNLRWEADMPVRPLEMPSTVRPRDEFELSLEDWWTPAQVSATLRSEPIEVDAGQSQASLIQFPRELVALRKMRPRLSVAEGGTGDHGAQLSIFEVEPTSISTEPSPEPAPESPETAWSGAGWSGMQLEAQPMRAEIPRADASHERGPYLASIGLRSMAIVVDGSLIIAITFAGAIWLMSKMAELPSPKTAEALIAAGILLAGFAYHALFFKLAGTTPGMHYAGIAVCTFNNEVPTQPELRQRLGAMALSLLPVGLGMVWTVFDEDHLSWHDRISGTYLRKR